MMPWAKMAACEKAPPTNMLYMLNRSLVEFAKNELRALESMPGVGTSPPRRYSTSIPSVKRIRFLRSGIFQIWIRL
jgi:hypothetical protein